MINFICTYYDFYLFLFSSIAGLFFSIKATKIKEDRALSIALSFLFCFAISLLVKRVIYATTLIAYLIRIIISFLFGFLSIYFCKVFVNVCKRVLKSNFVNNNKYGLAIFVYTIIYLFINAADSIDTWVQLWYGTNYSMGFGSRFLIGQILHFFFRYVTSDIAYYFVLVIYVLISALLSYLLNELLKKNNNVVTWFLVLLFIASPGYINAYFNSANFGRLEIYGLLNSLAGIIIYEKIKNTKLKYLALTLLNILSTASYQGFVFMYYTVSLILMIYDVVSSNYNKQKLSLAICNVVVNCIGFLIFQFGTFVNFDSVDGMINAINKSSNVFVSGDALRYELFESLSTSFNYFNKSFLLTEYPRESLLFDCFVLSPLLFVFGYLYVNTLKASKNKTMYILFIPSFLTILPQFILNVDWSRWMISTNINLFFSIFYLIYKNDEDFTNSCVCLEKMICKNKYIFAVLLIYIASLSKFKAKEYLSEVITIIKTLGRF